jgi:AcrR family transcriptional regulator
VAAKRQKGARRTPIQRRSKATVDVVLEAAAQILMRRGYDAATTNEIARRAGVSIGTLYQYFPDKAALFKELLARHLAARRAVLSRVMSQATPQTLSRVIRQVIHAIVESSKVHPRLHHALHERAGAALVDAFDRESEALLTGVFRANAAALRRHNPELAAAVLVRAFAGLTRTNFRREPDWLQRPEVEAELTELALRYLVKDEDEAVREASPPHQ